MPTPKMRSNSISVANRKHPAVAKSTKRDLSELAHEKASLEQKGSARPKM